MSADRDLAIARAVRNQIRVHFSDALRFGHVGSGVKREIASTFSDDVLYHIIAEVDVLLGGFGSNLGHPAGDLDTPAPLESVAAEPPSDQADNVVRGEWKEIVVEMEEGARMARREEHARAVAIIVACSWVDPGPLGPCWCGDDLYQRPPEAQNDHEDNCAAARAYCEEKP
jgi:hypothetical protein